MTRPDNPRPETAHHRAAFEAFYAADRSFRKVSETFHASERTLLNWAIRYGWTERADRRDREAARKAESDAIARRAKMLEEQRRIGQALRNAGAAYLQANGQKSATSMKDAVAAISKGFELERQAEGLPDWVGKIIDASDDALRDEYADLLRHATEAGGDPGGSEAAGDLPSEERGSPDA